jgi:hypothetical protein
MYLIENILFYWLLTWSIIILLEKWGIRDELSGRAPNEIIQKAIECNFCFAHHIAAVLVVPEIIILFDYKLLFVPLFVATITNKCLN